MSGDKVQNHSSQDAGAQNDVGQAYDIKIETVVVGDETFQLQSLKDLQQFSDPDGEAERLGISSANWSLFGILWPSGYVLAKTMQAFPLEDKTILEIGCGLGFASLVMHQRGGDVTASDYHPMAGTFLNENTALNHLPPIKFHLANWFDENPTLGRFDLIVGSDILYERGHAEGLASFIHRHSNDGAEVIVVDPIRGSHNRFSRAMATLGYSHRPSKSEVREVNGELLRRRILRYCLGDECLITELESDSHEPIH